MNEKFLGKKRALQRLSLAQLAFRQAKSLCEHIEKMQLQSHDELASAMMTGIVVSYMRPFLESNGLGALPPRYSQFDKCSPYEAIHNTLLEARHWVYAHRDLPNSINLAGSNISLDEVSEMTLTLREKNYSIDIKEPYIFKIGLSKFKELFSFQHERANEEVGNIICSLMEDHQVGVGTYKLNKNFVKIS